MIMSSVRRNLLHAMLAAALLGMTASYDLYDDEDLDIERPKSFIVNGTESQPGRYPWYTSLRYKRYNGTYGHSCGASLLTDRLILTAAHCVRESRTLNLSRPADPEDFEALGLNFTSFPNSYIKIEDHEDYAFIGAQGYDVAGIEPNEVVLWHLNPQYYYPNLYADIAVGLLEKPVHNIPKVKILSSSTDIYQLIDLDQPLYAIGLGNYVSDVYSDLLESLNFTNGKINSDPSKKLQEADVGSLLPRAVCGLANTVSSLGPTNDGSGNFEFNTGLKGPVIIPESQICVTPASDEHIEEYIDYVEKELVKGIQLLANQRNESLSDGEAYEEISPLFDYIASTAGACQGDSGGPLVLKGSDYTTDIQIGLTSYGLGCGHPLGGMWTNIQSFLQAGPSGFDDWLLDVLNHYPDERTQLNTATSIPSSMSNVATSG